MYIDYLYRQVLVKNLCANILFLADIGKKRCIKWHFLLCKTYSYRQKFSEVMKVSVLRMKNTYVNFRYMSKVIL